MERKGCDKCGRKRKDGERYCPSCRSAVRQQMYKSGYLTDASKDRFAADLPPEFVAVRRQMREARSDID